MPVTRKHSGPNGVNNYLPDNGSMEFDRDPVTNNVTTIRVTSPDGTVYEKNITYTPGGQVDTISEWDEV